MLFVYVEFPFISSIWLIPTAWDDVPCVTVYVRVILYMGTGSVFSTVVLKITGLLTFNVYLSHAYPVTLTGYNNSVPVPTNLTVTGYA